MLALFKETIMKKYRAAIFDIDDTLYDSKTKTFINSSIEGIKKLQENKVKVILATGRPPQTASAIFQYGVKPDYIVCVNGHIILNEDNQIIHQCTFSKDLVNRIYQYCLENDIGLLWKYPDLTYEYIHKDVFNNFYYKTKDSIKKVVFDIKDEHKRRCPNGGCLGCSSKKADVFNAHFAREAVAIKIDELSSDLLLYVVNKLSEVKTVLEKEKIGFHQCIGFGDNNNDLEILSEVKTSVAVGNGSEQLKQKVDYITDDIADDGVYKALVKFGLI